MFLFTPIIFLMKTLYILQKYIFPILCTQKNLGLKCTLNGIKEQKLTFEHMFQKHFDTIAI